MWHGKSFLILNLYHNLIFSCWSLKANLNIFYQNYFLMYKIIRGLLQTGIYCTERTALVVSPVWNLSVTNFLCKIGKESFNEGLNDKTILAPWFSLMNSFCSVWNTAILHKVAYSLNYSHWYSKLCFFKQCSFMDPVRYHS